MYYSTYIITGGFSKYKLQNVDSQSLQYNMCIFKTYKIIFRFPKLYVDFQNIDFQNIHYNNMWTSKTLKHVDF